MVKYLVFLANLIFALAGLVLIIVGVLYKIKLSEATKALPSDFGLAPVLCIVVGSVVFVTAFLGCCGAIKESPCMLTTFAIILLTIFIVQVAIAVYAFLKIKDKATFEADINKGLNEVFSNYTKGHEAIDVTQRWLECCGVNGPGYWRSQFRNDSLPIGCCPEKVQHCTIGTPGHFTDPCGHKLFKLIDSSAITVGGIAIGIAAVEIIGAIFALCLASSIRNHYRRNIYA